MNRLLYAEKVEKVYGTKGNVFKALNRIDLEVKKGEFTGIMGASGSGKSTLLNVLSTIDSVTAGHIWFGDTDITTLKEDGLASFRKEKLGFVFQDFNLLDTLTIEENITLALTLRDIGKSDADKQVKEIMKRLDIIDIGRKFPYEVSGGQKQRCACARAIINNPMIVMADEPTGALDSKSAQMLLDTFETMNGELEATILMVTHDVFSASYCKRILFLKDGEIFHELIRGSGKRREFLNKILDVLSLTAGGGTNA